MLNWLRGGPSAPADQPLAGVAAEAEQNPVPDNAVADVTFPEQDPAVLFPVKALRTAIFGTPAPKPRTVGEFAADLKATAEASDNRPKATKFSEKLKEVSGSDGKPGDKELPKRDAGSERPQPAKDSRSAKQPELKRDASSTQSTKATEPASFKISAKPNLFDPSSAANAALPPKSLFEATPARPSSPTKGILHPPGTALSRKKAVSFHPSISDETPKPRDTRVRSGLPHEFPGKFPSPWTPRTGNTPKLRASKHSFSVSGLGNVGSLEATSKPITPTAVFQVPDVDEQSRIEDILNDPDVAIDDIPLINDADLTVDMGAPRSESGKYWKSHAEKVEGLALTKVDRLRQRSNTAIEYAKRKDELCVDLAEKLREVLNKNQLLKNELRKIQRGGQRPNLPEENMVVEAMQLLEEKEAEIAGKDEALRRLQAQLDQQTTKTEAYEDMLNCREEKIAELSMSFFASDNAASVEDVDDLKQKLRKARQEAKEIGPLRLQCRTQKATINSLENENQRLESQIAGISDPSNTSQSSDIVTKLRVQIDELERARRDMRMEMRTKASEASKGHRLAEKAMRDEIAELKTKLVDEELDRKELIVENKHLKSIVSELQSGQLRDSSAGEWQKKHRETLIELRRVKEELSNLKAQGQQTDTFPEKPTGLFSTIPQKIGEVVQEPGSSSDDSAIDRSYDHSKNFMKSTHRPPSRKQASPKFEIPTQTPQGPNDQPLILSPPSPPSLSSSPFGSQERQQQNPYPPINPPVEPAPDTPIRPDDSFAARYKQKPSPRPSVVHWSASPKKRVSAARRAGSLTHKAFEGMDPARRAAAERRIAERRARRKTAGL